MKADLQLTQEKYQQPNVLDLQQVQQLQQNYTVSRDGAEVNIPVNQLRDNEIASIAAVHRQIGDAALQVATQLEAESKVRLQPVR